MTKDDACLKLHAFIADFLEQHQYYLDSGAPVSSKDEAALIIGSVTPSLSEPKTNVLFYCASSLDPSSPPVTTWIDECMDAARRSCPDEITAAQQLAVSCIRHGRPGLVQ